MSATGRAVLASPARAAVAALLLAAAGAALPWWSAQAVADAQRALEQARHDLARGEAALQAARELDAALAPALQRWQTLEQAGALAVTDVPQQRHAVAEALLRHGIDASAADVHFAAPQLLPPADAALPAIVLAPVRLQLPLRHEGRLPPLLAALEALPGGVVAVRGCTVERLPAPTAGHDRLRADCRLDWLTLRLPPAGGGR